MNLLLGVVPHSSSLVIMAIPMPNWDYLSQVWDSQLWITIRDFLLPPDMLAMRRAGPKWNHAKLCGFFPALRFFLMENGEDTKGKTESLPEWPILRGNLRQRFDDYESEMWPLDVTGSVFGHLMRNRGDLCIIVTWCAQNNTIIHCSCCSFRLLHKFYFQRFFFALGRSTSSSNSG